MKNVWILYIDDHRENPTLYGAYDSEEKARAAFKDILLNSYWYEGYTKAVMDDNYISLGEIIETMVFNNGSDYMYVECMPVK